MIEEDKPQQNKLVVLSLNNPHLIFVIMLALSILGTIAYVMIPKDLLPTFRIPAVQVLTLYPGMPAEVVEKDITSRLERWTGQSIGISHQESRSLLGVSIVRDFFRSDIDLNTALGQVTSLAMSDLYYLPPGTIPPMVMPFDPTATIPLVLLSISSDNYDETKLYDIAYFDLRNRLQGISGVIAPAVYGGKLRRILTYVNPDKLKLYNLSSMNVLDTINQFNTLIPAGNMKIGDKDYQIVTNGMVHDVRDINRFPVRSTFQGKEVAIADVANTQDSSQIQSNIVRVNGKRQVYIPVYRQPGANTIAVVDGIRDSIASILKRLPSGISIDLVADQSKYVRAAINSLTLETLLGGVFAALVIWLFLGNFIISLSAAIAIPISILIAFLCLYFSHDSLNAMTLGGLALAIGRLVDDSIVVTENITRHRNQGMGAYAASAVGASEVMLPVLAATITTLIVFVPVFFLTGMSQFLFAPLAKSVVYSITASFFVAMMLTPILLRYTPDKTFQKQYRFSSLFERFQAGYRFILQYMLKGRYVLYTLVFILLVMALFLFTHLGRELFPYQDVGQISMKVRLASGTRIEKTEEATQEIEQDIKEVIQGDALKTVVANLGVLYDWPAAYTPNAGPQDVFFEIQLGDKREHSSQWYAESLRKQLAEKYPNREVQISTTGALTAALTFGQPAPIDIQIIGNDLHTGHDLAQEIITKMKSVQGLEDIHIKQRLDYPQIAVNLDRKKIADVGLNTLNVVKNLVSATNSSINFDPGFWIDPKNGNHYFLGVQYPEEQLNSLDVLKEILIDSKQQERPVPLKELARFDYQSAPTEINHHNINRVTDIFASVSGRDIGSVSHDIQQNLKKIKPPSGYKIVFHGEMSNVAESFKNLGYGFILAVVLIYLALVAQFRSLKDPFIILIAVPMGLIGVVLALKLTFTTLNIQSFLGTLFMAGIAVANSILIVEFINHKYRGEGLPLKEAIYEGASLRLRPILMTTLAALVALTPMAIGMGHGSEANIPLARAVIGGLSVSTILSLLVVPCLYYSFYSQKEQPHEA